MRVFVTGATGALGTAAVAALLSDGHEVTGLARSESKARLLQQTGVAPVRVSLFDTAAMTAALKGHDAVCNLATSIPTGLGGLRPGAWKANDRLRTEGSRVVAAAAMAAGVRRLVQESISFMYADGGDAWITETSAVCVTRAVEPAVVAETSAAGFATGSRHCVVLRFANIVGDDALTRWRLAQAKAGRPVGIGDPHGWAHVVHLHDAGASVAAALNAPSGVYNVGAEPVRRDALAGGFAVAAGRSEGTFAPRWMVKVAGERLEPLTRSHRVSSAKLREAARWKREHDTFDPSWLRDLESSAEDAEVTTDPVVTPERRRFHDVFGDVLPDTTRDERGSSWGESADNRDEALRRDVPPHHG